MHIIILMDVNFRSIDPMLWLKKQNQVAKKHP